MPSIFTGTASDGIAKRNPVIVDESATVRRLLGHGSKQAKTPDTEQVGGSCVGTEVESWGTVVESTDCEFFPPPQLAITTARAIPQNRVCLRQTGAAGLALTGISRGLIP